MPLDDVEVHVLANPCLSLCIASGFRHSMSFLMVFGFKYGLRLNSSGLTQSPSFIKRKVSQRVDLILLLSCHLHQIMMAVINIVKTVRSSLLLNYLQILMNVPVLKQTIVTQTLSVATLKDRTAVVVTKDTPETVETAQVPC